MEFRADRAILRFCENEQGAEVEGRGGRIDEKDRPISRPTRRVQGQVAAAAQQGSFSNKKENNNKRSL